MKKVPALLRKEFVSYFQSPIPYVILTLFLLVSGLFFYVEFRFLAEASLRRLVPSISIVLMILTPAVTMRLLAEEKRSGTLEVLMTDPITEWELVLGKFLGALAFYLAMVSPALLYGLLFEVFGDPDWTAILWSCAGLVLFGSVLVSIGLFASSLTRNQVIAYILAFVSVLFLFLVGDFASMAGGGIETVGRTVGIQDHYESFAKGVLDTRDLVYFLSTAALFLFLTARVVESRRWK
jgi:ABC-2 type transport system permease protein